MGQRVKMIELKGVSQDEALGRMGVWMAELSIPFVVLSSALSY